MDIISKAAASETLELATVFWRVKHARKALASGCHPPSQSQESNYHNLLSRSSCILSANYINALALLFLICLLGWSFTVVYHPNSTEQSFDLCYNNQQAVLRQATSSISSHNRLLCSSFSKYQVTVYPRPRMTEWKDMMFLLCIQLESQKQLKLINPKRNRYFPLTNWPPLAGPSLTNSSAMYPICSNQKPW